MLCLSKVAKAQENSNNLIVWSKDGTKVTYALMENPKVRFTESDLIISTNNIEVNYSLENIARFTYELKENTAVRNLKNDEVSFKMNGELLLFSSLKANSTVSIYSLNGTLVFNKTVKSAGDYSYPLSGLNTGVYFVKVNSLTYKIVKR